MVGTISLYDALGERQHTIYQDLRKGHLNRGVLELSNQVV
jgi:hypothetical protein